MKQQTARPDGTKRIDGWVTVGLVLVLAVGISLLAGGDAIRALVLRGLQATAESVGGVALLAQLAGKVGGSTALLAAPVALEAAAAETKEAGK